MAEKTRRPASIWIAQVLLCIFGFLFFLSLAFNIFLLLRTGLNFAGLFRFMLLFIVTAILVSPIIISFWGLLKRRKYGRWMTIITLGLLWLILIFTQLFPVAGPIKYFEYDNPAQAMGGMIARWTMDISFLILLLRLSFGKKARDFFLQDNQTTKCEPSV
jgi:hypothetical protein